MNDICFRKFRRSEGLNNNFVLCLSKNCESSTYKYAHLSHHHLPLTACSLYSNLYAQGTSPHARAFNCIQRSHQHIFETFGLAAISGYVGSLVFPITTGMSTLIYSVGRYYLSKGYAECCEDGDPSKRYKYPLARGTWYGLLGNVLLGMGACALVACGKKKF